MCDTGHGFTVGAYQDIQIDKFMPFVNGIGGHAAEGCEFLAYLRCGKIPHMAADMNPWAQYNVVPECPVT